MTSIYTERYLQKKHLKIRHIAQPAWPAGRVMIGQGVMGSNPSLIEFN